VIVPGLIPIGTQNENATLAKLVELGAADFNLSTPEKDLWTKLDKAFDSWTGRANLQAGRHRRAGDGGQEHTAGQSAAGQPDSLVLQL
jgi:hypothetical protein